MEKKISINNQEYSYQVLNKNRNTIHLEVDGQKFQYEVFQTNNHEITLIDKGSLKKTTHYIQKSKSSVKKGFTIFNKWGEYKIVEETQLKKNVHANEMKDMVLSPMPGKILKVNVKVGDEVKTGQTLLILEAMKMEQEIKSLVDGVVEEICCKMGEIKDHDDLLMKLKEQV